MFLIQYEDLRTIDLKVIFLQRNLQNKFLKLHTRDNEILMDKKGTFSKECRDSRTAIHLQNFNKTQGYIELPSIHLQNK